MKRVVIISTALAVACSADEFVETPVMGSAETAVFLVRGVEGSWRREVLDAQSGPLRLTDPQEVYVLRYLRERPVVEAWLEGEGGLERCGLLGGRAQQLRLNEPVEFRDVALPEALNAELLPEWSELCVSCRPFKVRSINYPAPQGSLDEIRTGGGHAPLPSGAFLAAGRPEEGIFRVSSTDAVRMEADFDARPSVIHRLPGGGYLASEPRLLRWFEVDAGEMLVTTTTVVRVEDLGDGQEITAMQVTPPGQPFAAFMTDSRSRVLRTDGRSLEVLLEVPDSLRPSVYTGSLVILGRDHFFATLDQPRVFEWRDGRLTRYELGVLAISTIASIPGFGLLAGNDAGEVWALEPQGWRSLGLAGLRDDVHRLLPYRNGFIAVLKGGFISQYATHLDRFCPEMTGLPGAQNAELTAMSPVPDGFFCSNCSQSRSGGAYGATWIELPN